MAKETRGPVSMAGIISFSDARVGGPQLSPQVVIGFAVVFVLLIMFVRLLTT